MLVLIQEAVVGQRPAAGIGVCRSALVERDRLITHAVNPFDRWAAPTYNFVSASWEWADWCIMWPVKRRLTLALRSVHHTIFYGKGRWRWMSMHGPMS
jgi:hypothetical protein